MASQPDPNALTRTIASSVETYLTRLAALDKTPDFTSPFPEIIQDETAQKAKLDILRSCERLMALVQGPVQWLMFQNMAFVDPACIGLAIELGIHEIVAPGDEPTGLDRIVEETGAGREVIRMFFCVDAGWVLIDKDGLCAFARRDCASRRYALISGFILRFRCICWRRLCRR